MRFLIPLFLLVNFVYAQTNIVVSILPQKTFVEKIGGDKVKVTNMVRPGNDPHTYEPKPSQMRDIAKASIYFPIGLEFENTWLAKFASQNKDMKFIEMTRDINYMEMAKHSHHHHDEHGDKESALPYEWAGVFDLKKGNYSWSFSKVESKYADPAMKMLIFKANKKDDDLIESYEKQAKNIFANDKAKTVKNNSSLETNNSFYTLSFDEQKDKTIFKVEIKQDGKYIFYTEHMPVEFEADEHYFKDSLNNDIEVLTSVPEEEAHHGKDPHVWVSPKNVKIIAKNIYDTLVEFDSINKEYYKTNYNNFIQEINQTDAKIKNIFSVLPQNSKFMVFHPSWGYFAKEYHLEQLVIEVEGKEPKPKILQEIIKKAKEEKVKAIFTQREFSDKSAKVIAAELKIKVIKETPLAANWSQNLIQMADAIANNN